MLLRNFGDSSTFLFFRRIRAAGFRLLIQGCFVFFCFSAAFAASSIFNQTSNAGPKQIATPNGTTNIPQRDKSMSVISRDFAARRP